MDEVTVLRQGVGMVGHAGEIAGEIVLTMVPTLLCDSFLKIVLILNLRFILLIVPR